MRTDRELTALFAGAVVDEAPDPTFLDELFALLVEEVASLPATVERPRSIAWRLQADRWPALIAASLALAIGLGALLRFGGPFGGPTPSPTPTLSPSPTPGATVVLPSQPVTPSSTLVPFTSSTYGYSISYPSNFAVRLAAGSLDRTTYPTDSGPNTDYFSASAPTVGDPGLIIAGPTVAAGTTLAQWSTSIQQLQAATVGCPPPQATEAVVIGGVPGQLQTWVSCPAWLLWAGVVNGDHAFHVIWIDQFATSNPAIQAADKALFLKILASFRFTAPAGSPSSSAPFARQAEPGTAIPDSMLGAWFVTSGPAFPWIYRAGSPYCVQALSSSQDCMAWQQPDGRTTYGGVLTIINGRLAIRYLNGSGCQNNQGLYDFTATATTLTLVDTGNGTCGSGDYHFTRAGTGSAPTSPPEPQP